MSETPSGDEGRASERKMVGIKAQLREGTIWKLDVEVEDLSETGFRIDTTSNIAVGTKVFLKIPSFEGMEAVVTRREGMRYGCRFVRPLYPAVFDTIAARYRSG
jgi:PilZ domain